MRRQQKEGKDSKDKDANENSVEECPAIGKKSKGKLDLNENISEEETGLNDIKEKEAEDQAPKRPMPFENEEKAKEDVNEHPEA